MVPTPSRPRQTIAPNRKAPAPLPPAQADRASDPHHHTHISHPSSPTPAPPPLDLLQHWQSLLAEKTALLGYEITPPPDRLSSATRKLRTKSTLPSRPASAHPAILAKPGLGERMSVDGEGFSSARAAAKRSPSTPATTTARPPRLPRRRNRSSCRRSGVGFCVAA